MAADADAPDGELNKKAAKARSPASSDRTEDGPPVSPADDGPTSAGEADEVDAGADEAEDCDAAVEDEENEDVSDNAAPAKPRISHVAPAAIIGAAIIVAIAAIVGWLGFRSYQSHQAEDAAPAVSSDRTAVRAESDDD